MIDAATTAFVALMDPFRLLMLFVGILAGGFIGLLPGLGGVATISILLPFVYSLEPFAGLAMLIGALGVGYTSDTITSVLVGTPGSPASAPTAIEGFAMARRGEAGRALSAGFLSSVLGGLVGAIVLTFAIPIAGPLVLALGTPEILMLSLVGLSYASGLIGDSRAKGLAAAAIGLLLGTIGVAPAAAELRYTFGAPYLLEGLSLVVVALGFFGVAEVMSMLGQGGAISQKQFKLTGWGEGARDVLRNWTLAIRGSLIGVFVGLIPAVGANASTWIAYGHAVQTSKDKSKFGKGDVRGIVASEGANSATPTTDLVPTLLFGVPGGPAAAVFLGAMFVYGYYPGPRFVAMHQDVMFLIIWSAAISAVVGAALCFFISPYVAKLTRLEFGLIAAPLILVMMIGAFDATESYADLLVLIAFGIVGMLMKTAGWPRAPLLVGFVLADPIERNFWLTYQIHGWGWLSRPIVLGLIAVILVSMLWGLWKSWTGSRVAVAAEGPTEDREWAKGWFDLNLVLAAGLGGLFGYAIIAAMGFRADSRLGPLLAAIPGLLSVLAILIMRLTGSSPSSAWPSFGETTQIALLGAAILMIPLIGFLPAIGIYALLMLLLSTSLRIGAVPYAAVVVLLGYLMARVLGIQLP